MPRAPVNDVEIKLVKCKRFQTTNHKHKIHIPEL